LIASISTSTAAPAAAARSDGWKGTDEESRRLRPYPPAAAVATISSSVFVHRCFVGHVVLARSFACFGHESQQRARKRL
jgi:hypothetical protein